VVQVYDARFEEASLYQLPWLEGEESDGAPFRARWCDSASFNEASPLVPEGLQVLLTTLSLLR
jgi:hypothetical protein